MNQLSDRDFVTVQGQVAIPDHTVAKLLNVTLEKLHHLSRKVGITNQSGGIYDFGGKLYYTSSKIVFKVRNANGKDSADLSRFKLMMSFLNAEERLLSKEQLEAKQKSRLVKGVAVVLAIVGLIMFSPSSSQKETSSSSTSRTRFMVKSKYTIEKTTGHYVTDSWPTKYSEQVRKNGTVDTHGFIELDNDGIKRQFWLKFDEKTEAVLRVKIDSELIYSSMDW